MVQRRSLADTILSFSIYLSLSLSLEERGLKYMAKPSQYCKLSSDLKITLKNNGRKCEQSLNWVMG